MPEHAKGEGRSADRRQESLDEKMQSGKIKVCIIGMGRIGLPTAISFAEAGFDTTGLDINVELVEKINSGEFPLKDEPGYGEMFDSAVSRGRLRAVSRAEDVMPYSDVILLSLPTPMDHSNIPDYSALESVGEQLCRCMPHGSLVIVESTVEPGFVEDILVPIIEGRERRLVAGKDFGIGVCPETANPGQILRDFENLPRLIGAIDEEARDAIEGIYRRVFTVDFIPMPDCKTANAVKLTTNVFRDVNIAFVNELALLFEKLGIDIMTVLEAAKAKYNFQVHYPGPGVGGPCLPVNSYQYINTGSRIGFTPRLIRTGREINESMPSHVVDLLADAFGENGMPLEGSTVLILGVSYKPDIRDTQISPARHVIDMLKKLGVGIRIYDPYFKSENVFGVDAEEDLGSLSSCDGIVLVTSHKEFYDIDPAFLKNNLRNPVFIDSRCVLDQKRALDAGLVYRGIGRERI